jgi:hypothetical protein
VINGTSSSATPRPPQMEEEVGAGTFKEYAEQIEQNEENILKLRQGLNNEVARREQEISEERSERKHDIAAERARIDALTRLGEGSTTGDAELIDARVDKDGIEHTNVGEHIRSVSGEIVDLYDYYVTDKFTVHNMEVGGLSGAGETIDNRRLRSGYFSCTDAISFIVTEGYKISVFSYDKATKSYITNTEWITEDNDVIGNSKYLYRYMIAKTDDSAIALEETENVVVTIKNKNVQAQIDELFNRAKDKVVYVSTNGSDSNDGSVNSAFKTIAHALTVGNIILVSPGLYSENNIIVDGKDNVVISASGSGSVYIDNSEELSLSAGADGLLRQAKTTNGSDILNTVFVKKTTPIEDTSSTRSKGYNVTLWENKTKLKPLLTYDECLATKGSFTYDGTNIYVNPTSGVSNAKYRLVHTWSNCIKFSNCKNVKLVDIHCQYVRSSVCHIENCKNVDIENCSFSYSNIGEGLALIDCSGIVRNSNADYNRNDGFNIHGKGTTNFYDCYASNNYDDGISHHDESDGVIRGGEFSYNGKGGVSSPTYGAKVDIYDIEAHHNNYGVYAVADSNANTTFKLHGCILYDNIEKDLYVDNYVCKSYRSKYTTSGKANSGRITILD